MRGGPGRRRWPGEPHGYVKSRKDESQPALRFPDPTVPAEMGEHRENAAVRAAGGFLRRGWGLSAGLGCCSRTACRHSPPSPVHAAGHWRRQDPLRGREELQAVMLTKEEEKPSEGKRAQRSQLREPLPKSPHGSRLA